MPLNGFGFRHNNGDNAPANVCRRFVGRRWRRFRAKMFSNRQRTNIDRYTFAHTHKKNELLARVFNMRTPYLCAWRKLWKLCVMKCVHDLCADVDFLSEF